MTLRHWYRIENKAETPAAADVYIYDSIGKSFWNDESVTAKRFIDDLKALPSAVTEIRVHVNSPGGDVFDAVAITNALRAQRDEKGRTVTMEVEGLAASAASVVLMAGSTIRMADNALLMVHEPWSIAIGNAQDMLDTAALLEKVRGTIIATYRWQSPLDEAELSALMQAETWMDADEAIEKGFATEKVEGLRAAAALAPQAVSGLKVPDRFKARVEALLEQKPAPESKPAAASPLDIVRACNEAECAELAEALIAANATSDQVQARIADATSAKQAQAKRAKDVEAACTLAGLPELAEDYVAGAMPIASIQRQLATVKAKLDRVEIDANLKPDQGAKSKTVINVTDVYAERNRAHYQSKE